MFSVLTRCLAFLAATLFFLSTAPAELSHSNALPITSNDESRLGAGKSDLSSETVASRNLPAPRTIGIGQVLSESDEGSWVTIEGRVARSWQEREGLVIELTVGSSWLTVVVAGEPGALNPIAGCDLRVTGFCHTAFNSAGQRVPHRLLAPSHSLVEVVAKPPERNGHDPEAAGQDTLTTAIQVHQLQRSEAELAIPAKVRGVVTSTDRRYGGFTIQDATGGLYITASDPMQIGEFVQVEGRTDAGQFAPMLIPDRITHIGRGRIPEPIRPAWDQLMNGSLDAQYVEIEGIVTAVMANALTLATRGGVLKISLDLGGDPEKVNRIRNSLIRIRGVLIAIRNAATHQVRMGEIRIFNAEISVQNPAPADVFDAPYKTPAALLLFDPEAGLFQRIRMSGQIIHVRGDLCFLTSGGAGVRLVARSPAGLRVGDTVEVAGYPQLGGASPLLREAAIRKTGHAPLPQPVRLQPGNVFLPEYDSTRVVIEGILAGVRLLNGSDSRSPGSKDLPAIAEQQAQAQSIHAAETGEEPSSAEETLLDLHFGTQNVVARVKGRDPKLASLPNGCRVELTGVYAAQVASPPPDRRVGAFELLLDSSAGVTVLARPPWWTLRRMVFTLSALACVLVLALLWITQLHRKVDQRTIQLEEQIQKRKTIEQHRAMEQERARVAQDLHDELGSGLTEISMLAAVSGAGSAPCLSQIADRAQHMVTALDEIVWAMNPRHDSLESLGSYVCLYADRMLKLAGIACCLEGSLDLPGIHVNAVHRHQLFLAFKEALNNVIRHSGAREVRLGIRMIGDSLRVSLSDDGRGFTDQPSAPGMDGLASMRERLARIGGRFALATRAGRGTTVRMYLPLK